MFKGEEAVFLSITTDIWTSMATESYITVTVHYVDNSWGLQAYVLRIRNFTFPRAAEDWEIVDTVRMVSHDQGSNMKAVVEILHDELNWQSLHCTAHCLQLCILAGFKITIIDRLLSAAKKIVTHFHHSVVATQGLKQKHEEMNMSGKKLINSCVTR